MKRALLADRMSASFYIQTVGTFNHITAAQCAAFSGLSSKEMVLAQTSIRNSLHSGYLLHHEKGWEGVRDIIVVDTRASPNLGASKHAADLLIVLRWLLSERLVATFARSLHGPAEIVSFPSSSRVFACVRL